MRHLGEFECRSRFSTWLTRIVINAALMRLRKSRREGLTSIDQNLDQGEAPMADTLRDPQLNPEETYVCEERLQFLSAKSGTCLRVTAPSFGCGMSQGMSTREAAETLGVKTATVKSQLHRARRGLKGSAVRLGPGLRTKEGRMYCLFELLTVAGCVLVLATILFVVTAPVIVFIEGMRSILRRSAGSVPPVTSFLTEISKGWKVTVSDSLASLNSTGGKVRVRNRRET